MTGPETDKVANRPTPIKLDGLRLGASDLQFEVGSQAEVRAVTLALAAQTQRTLLIHTEDLQSAIYDEPTFLAQISRVARAHGQSHIWILIQDGRKAVQRGHRLVETARRLSSAIQLRRPAPQYRTFHESLLLADGLGYLHRPIAARYEGTANFHDPGTVVAWEKYFMEVWEHSEPDEEIRRLYL